MIKSSHAKEVFKFFGRPCWRIKPGNFKSRIEAEGLKAKNFRYIMLNPMSFTIYLFFCSFKVWILFCLDNGFLFESIFTGCEEPEGQGWGRFPPVFSVFYPFYSQRDDLQGQFQSFAPSPLPVFQSFLCLYQQYINMWLKKHLSPNFSF